MAESDKVGVAVFGLGRAGQFHLPNLGSNLDVVVRWLVDVSEVKDRATELCDRFGLKVAQFVDSGNTDKVFSDPETKAVIVTAPTRFHEEIVKRALQAGKHVFCEKPIAFTAAVVKSCYDQARKQGKILFCGFNKRFDELHVQLRRCVQNGELGTLRRINYHWRDPNMARDYLSAYVPPSGGIFCDSAIHQLDYVPWLVGERPISVVALGSVTSLNADIFQKSGDVDTTSITLQFPSGVLAVIEITRELHLDDFYLRIEAVGTKGTQLLHKSGRDRMTSLEMDGQGRKEVKDEALDLVTAYKLEMNCFVRMVQGKESCPTEEWEVIQASRLADLCLTSLKEGRVMSYSPL